MSKSKKNEAGEPMNETYVEEKTRRVYRYRGRNLICFLGQRYLSPEDSKVDPEKSVTKVECANTEAAPDTVTVTQRVPKKKGITEEWTILEA